MTETIVASNGTVGPIEIPDIGWVDLDRGFKFWHLPEVYTGKNGTGRWCPNVDDGIIDWSTGFRRVTGIDITTGL